jgi:Putative prokaryotic signal transducing protein
MSDPDVPRPLVVAFSTTSIPEGLLVKGLLEAEGIPVTVKGESEGPYRVGPVYLWVPEDLEDRARQIIEEAQSADLSDDGDRIEGGTTASSTEEPSGPS